MKLSEAILMGDSLKKANSNYWLWIDGNDSCGCALGGAILAVGKGQEFVDDWGTLNREWPWLTRDHADTISMLYSVAITGQGSIEDVCAYVRSIEPPEPEPLPEEEFTDEPAELAVYRGRL